MRKSIFVATALISMTALLVTSCGKKQAGGGSTEEMESQWIELASESRYPYSWSRNDDGSIALKITGEWTEGSSWEMEVDEEDVITVEDIGSSYKKNSGTQTYQIVAGENGFSTLSLTLPQEGFPSEAYYQINVNFYVDDEGNLKITSSGVRDLELTAINDGEYFLRLETGESDETQLYIYDMRENPLKDLMASVNLSESTESVIDEEEEEGKNAAYLEALEENPELAEFATEIETESDAEEVVEEESEDAEESVVETTAESEGSNESESVDEETLRRERALLMIASAWNLTYEDVVEEAEADEDEENGANLVQFIGQEEFEGGYLLRFRGNMEGTGTITLTNDILGITLEYTVTVEIPTEEESEEGEETENETTEEEVEDTKSEEEYLWITFTIPVVEESEEE